MAFQLDWPYFVDAQDATVTCMNGGTSACSDGVATVTCGTNPFSGAGLQGRFPLAAVGRDDFSVEFTATFDTRAGDGSLQVAGVGDGEHGVFVGYNGPRFGVRLLTGGRMQFYQVTIANDAVQTGTLSLTLNGTVLSYAVQQGDSVMSILTSICRDPSVTNANMTTCVLNHSVYLATALAFPAFSAPQLTDTGTGCGASVQQLVAGQEPLDLWVSPEDWNGAGLSRPTSIDWGKGNTFKVTVSSLGYGTITVSVMDPVSLAFTDLHGFTNANSTRNLNFLGLGLIPSMYSCNFTGNTALTVGSTGFLVSAGPASILPARIRPPFCHAVNAAQLRASPTAATLLVLQNMVLVRGVRNCKVMSLASVTLNVACQQPCQVALYKDPTFDLPLSGAWHDPGSCVVVDDTTRASMLGGTLLRSWLATSTLDLTVPDLPGCWAEPGSRLAFCVSCLTGPAALTAGLAVTWQQT